MKKEIINFRDLTDSREILDSRTPTFITFFILLVLTIVITGLIWLWVGEIDIIVKATGIVRPGETVSVIRNARSGNLSSVNYYSGKQVNEGELLYAVDIPALEEEKESVKKSIKELQEEIISLKRLKTALNNDANIFNNEDEKYYYNRYLNYQNNLQRLQIEYNQAKSQYEKKKTLGVDVVSESRLEELKATKEVAALKLKNYRLDVKINIEKEIKDKREKLKQQKQRLREIENEIELAYITAPIGGEIKVQKSYNKGDYISAGVEVLKIIPGSSGGLIMELTVDNKDIGKLEINQKIKYRFLTFSYKEYGILTGKIFHIAGDSNLQGEKDKIFPYEAKATIEKKKLKNNKGEIAKVRTGMLCQARIVTGRKKLLYVLLEKLDFIS